MVIIEEDDEEDQSHGLKNSSNLCYCNSILQLWFYNPIIRQAILSWKPPQITENELGHYEPVGPIAELQALFARMKISKQP